VNCSTFAEFEDDPDLYVLKPLKYIGIEVWQVSYVLYSGLFKINGIGCSFV
jgi:hypothetical protein